MQVERLMQNVADLRDARDAAVAERSYTPEAEARKQFRQQKAALTRALNTSDPDKRAEKVVAACLKAMGEWDNWRYGWPDNWNNWEHALEEALGWGAPTLRELESVAARGEA